jgi:ABC-type transport system involved in cytochrome c biogenesis permease subunit
MSYRSVLLTALLLGAAVTRAADLPTDLNLETLRALPTQHDGRMPPLDTLARETVEEVTGTPLYQGYDPVLLLLAWTFDHEKWEQQPLISLRNAELRAALHLPAEQSTFSYKELVGHEFLAKQIAGLRTMQSGKKPDPLHLKVRDIAERLSTLEDVFTGQAIPLIPDPNSVITAWRPIGARAPAMGGMGHPPTEPEAVKSAWSALREALSAGDKARFDKASHDLASALGELPAAYRPPADTLARELRYNQMRPYHAAWQLLLIGTVLAALAALLEARWAQHLGGLKGLIGVVALIALLGGCGLHSYGMWLRWNIAGRLPATNMFESMLFLGWGAAVVAILAGCVTTVLRRGWVVPLTGAIMATLALFLADNLPIDRYIRPIAPVLLDTMWMSIHVPIIMTSYAVLGLAVVIAHAQLVLLAVAPRRQDLAARVDGMHYWYALVGSILLIAGIVTGSMWGSVSWGRYWGWDPKEVWSLVAFLGYTAILHTRLDTESVPAWARVVAAALAVAVFGLIASRFGPPSQMQMLAFGGAFVATAFFVLARGALATALKSVLAFWLIIMTYVGVNFVLGIGLHSYGFGTGAVARYMFLLGGGDLAFIALCALVYLFRGKSNASVGVLATA